MKSFWLYRDIKTMNVTSFRLFVDMWVVIVAEAYSNYVIRVECLFDGSYNICFKFLLREVINNDGCANM